MGLYEQIRDIAKEKGYSINKLEQELGFARSSINKFNKNKPSIDKLQQIADLLNVTVDYLTTGTRENDICSPCPDCGLWYDANNPDDVKLHSQQHDAWEKATNKFGKLYCNTAENERIKAENRNISHDTTLPLNNRLDAQIEVLRCLFSRSIEASGYDLRHVTFDVYVAMMLGNQAYIKNLEDDLYKALCDKYGTRSGIGSGSLYHIPTQQFQTAAARLDTSDLTNAELEDVKDYIEFIRNKRKNRS